MKNPARLASQRMAESLFASWFAECVSGDGGAKLSIISAYRHFEGWAKSRQVDAIPGKQHLSRWLHGKSMQVVRIDGYRHFCGLALR
jgi:hypothetical protein